MLTVREAARRARRNQATIRRWIREGRLRATKVGTQYVLEEEELDGVLGRLAATVPPPPEWTATYWGGPMPDFVSILRRQRSEH